MNDITSRFLEVYDTMLEMGVFKNAYDFAQKMNKSPSTITGMRKERVNIGIDLLQQVAKYYPIINTDYILNGVGEKFKKVDLGESDLGIKQGGNTASKRASAMKKVYNTDQKSGDFVSIEGKNTDKNADKLHDKTPQIKLSENINEPETQYFILKPNVVELTSQAAAGLGSIIVDQDRYKTLKTVAMPELGNGFHIRLPILGDSMYPTIKPDDKVVATLLENQDDFKAGKLYILTTKSNDCYVKRIFIHDWNRIRLVSDNDEYTPQLIDNQDIKQVFEVRQIHRFNLQPEISEFIPVIKAFDRRITLLERKDQEESK